MHYLKTIVAACGLGLAATASAQSPASPKVIEGADPAIWSGAIDKGPVTHRETGVVFP